MRSIGLAVRALAEEPAQNETLTRLETARSALSQMADLLERCMEVEPGRLRLVPSETRLGAAVHRIAEHFQAMAIEFGVHIDVEVTPAAAKLAIGPLEPVISNALKNAIESCRSTGRPGHVDVSVALKPGHGLMILVADNGRGLPPDFTIDGRTTKPDGHGLGLSLCREIVQNLRGRVRLTSVPFSAGTVFEAVVPIDDLGTT